MWGKLGSNGHTLLDSSVQADSLLSEPPGKSWWAIREKAKLQLPCLHHLMATFPCEKLMGRTGSRESRFEPCSVEKGCVWSAARKATRRMNVTRGEEGHQGSVQNINRRITGSGTTLSPEGDSGLPNQWWLIGQKTDRAQDPPWPPEDTWSLSRGDVAALDVAGRKVIFY